MKILNPGGQRSGVQLRSECLFSVAGGKGGTKGPRGTKGTGNRKANARAKAEVTAKARADAVASGLWLLQGDGLDEWGGFRWAGEGQYIGRALST